MLFSLPLNLIPPQSILFPAAARFILWIKILHRTRSFLRQWMKSSQQEEGCAISYVGLIESEPWMKYLNETSKVSSSNYATEYLKFLGRAMLTGECFISEMSHFTFCYALGGEKLLCMHEWSFQQIIMRTLQVVHDAVHLSFKNKSVWDALFNWVELFFAALNENVYLLFLLLRVSRGWRRILCWKLWKSLLHYKWQKMLKNSKNQKQRLRSLCCLLVLCKKSFLHIFHPITLSQLASL